MVSASAAAVFTVIAKDAASKALGTIGKSMGRLRSFAGMAFKAIVAGAAAAATAIAGLAIASIKGAIEDEKAQTRMIATLRARGLANEKNLASIEALIKAGERLGMTDDDVRKSIETATQYTNNFSKALEIQRVAQDLAVAKGIDLESATAMVGKAFQGNSKAFKALGIDLTKVNRVTEEKLKKDKNGWLSTEKVTKTTKEQIKGMAALKIILGQYAGIADEVANTTAVRLEATQIAINEKFEAFGYKFLPRVNDALTWFKDEILPQLEPLLEGLATGIGTVTEAILGKDGLIAALGDIATPIYDQLEPSFTDFGDAAGTLFDNLSKLKNLLTGTSEKDTNGISGALWLLAKPTEFIYDKITQVIEAINWVLENGFGLLKALGIINEGDLMGTFKTGQLTSAPGGGMPIRTPGPNFGAGMTTTSVTPIKLEIGTKAQSELAYKFGAGVNAATGTRNGAR